MESATTPAGETLPELERPIELLARLAKREDRPVAARALARRLGTHDLILFLCDPELGVMLPAPGFPQTLPGGREWAALVGRCGDTGRSGGELLPPGGKERVPVFARASSDGTVLVLLGGGPPSMGDVDQILESLPLLAAALSGERRLGMAESESAMAARAAERAGIATTALDRVRGELQRALGKLQEMDRRKDEFLALLAHELRNPLAPILTSLELLRIGAPDKAAQAREVIERNARHLARLIDDLLDVARIARGIIVLRRERVELSDLVASGVEIARPLITSRGHRLSVSLPDEEVWLEADPLRIAQVLSNLLNNAAKFTDPGGRIGLNASKQGDAAVIEVWDTGIGIAPQLLSRIFDLFAQEQSSLERSQGGLGVGLSLARRLIEMHGGVLTASSGGQGLGSEFRVTLPVLSAVEASAVSPLRPAQEEDRALSEPRGRRVLVVDDSPDTVAGLADLLREWGHSVETAGDGLSAVEVASTFRPDVVLLDIGLPGMDGFEVARRLRADSGFSDTVLIAVTGYGQETDRKRALEAGFDHHLLKPLDFARLETLLASSRSG